MSLFSISNLIKNNLEVKLQSGKGGSFFVIPKKGKLLIKSINEEEYDVVKSILPELYLHYLKYPKSYINPFYGCFALFLSDDIEPQYFVMMRNVLDPTVNFFTEKAQTLCFDLKGSTSGRTSLEDPTILLKPKIEEAILEKTLKDGDFSGSIKSLNLHPKQREEILSQFKEDAQFFSKFSLIDYSLLLFMIIEPYEVDNCKIIKTRSDKIATLNSSIKSIKSQCIIEDGKAFLVTEKEDITFLDNQAKSMNMDNNSMNLQKHTTDLSTGLFKMNKGYVKL